MKRRTQGRLLLLLAAAGMNLGAAGSLLAGQPKRKAVDYIVPTAAWGGFAANTIEMFSSKEKCEKVGVILFGRYNGKNFFQRLFTDGQTALVAARLLISAGCVGVGIWDLVRDRGVKVEEEIPKAPNVGQEVPNIGQVVPIGVAASAPAPSVVQNPASAAPASVVPVGAQAAASAPVNVNAPAPAAAPVAGQIVPVPSSVAAGSAAPARVESPARVPSPKLASAPDAIVPIGSEARVASSPVLAKSEASPVSSASQSVASVDETPLQSVPDAVAAIEKKSMEQKQRGSSEALRGLHELRKGVPACTVFRADCPESLQKMVAEKNMKVGADRALTGYAYVTREGRLFYQVASYCFELKGEAPEVISPAECFDAVKDGGALLVEVVGIQAADERLQESRDFEAAGLSELAKILAQSAEPKHAAEIAADDASSVSSGLEVGGSEIGAEPVAIQRGRTLSHDDSAVGAGHGAAREAARTHSLSPAGRGKPAEHRKPVGEIDRTSLLHTEPAVNVLKGKVKGGGRGAPQMPGELPDIFSGLRAVSGAGVNPAVVEHPVKQNKEEKNDADGISPQSDAHVAAGADADVNASGGFPPLPLSPEPTEEAADGVEAHDVSQMKKISDDANDEHGVSPVPASGDATMPPSGPRGGLGESPTPQAGAPDVSSGIGAATASVPAAGSVPSVDMKKDSGDESDVHGVSPVPTGVDAKMPPAGPRGGLSESPTPQAASDMASSADVAVGDVADIAGEPTATAIVPVPGSAAFAPAPENVKDDAREFAKTPTPTAAEVHAGDDTGAGGVKHSPEGSPDGGFVVVSSVPSEVEVVATAEDSTAVEAKLLGSLLHAASEDKIGAGVGFVKHDAGQEGGNVPAVAATQEDGEGAGEHPTYADVAKGIVEHDAIQDVMVHAAGSLPATVPTEEGDKSVADGDEEKATYVEVAKHGLPSAGNEVPLDTKEAPAISSGFESGPSSSEHSVPVVEAPVDAQAAVAGTRARTESASSAHSVSNIGAPKPATAPKPAVLPSTSGAGIGHRAPSPAATERELHRARSKSPAIVAGAINSSAQRMSPVTIPSVDKEPVAAPAPAEVAPASARPAAASAPAAAPASPERGRKDAPGSPQSPTTLARKSSLRGALMGLFGRGGSAQEQKPEGHPEVMDASGAAKAGSVVAPEATQQQTPGSGKRGRGKGRKK